MRDAKILEDANTALKDVSIKGVVYYILRGHRLALLSHVKAALLDVLMGYCYHIQKFFDVHLIRSIER